MLIQCTKRASTSLWRSLSAPMPSASSANPFNSLNAAIRRSPRPWALCFVIFSATIVYQEAGTPLLPAENCLSSIILSPLNGNVKMSPYEQGDICIEPERATTSGRYFQMREGGVGVSQSRLPVFAHALLQALNLAHAQTQESGGSGTRQSWAAQPPPPAPGRARAPPAAGPQHLRRLQRSPSLRETRGTRGLLALSRNASPA